MNTRERIALAWPPLFLRFALAVTFIWAGAGKIFQDFEVQGEKAALLANMGVLRPIAATPAPSPPPHPPASPGQSPPQMPAPTQPLPPGDSPKSAPPKAAALRPLAQAASTPLPPTSPPHTVQPIAAYRAQDFPNPQKVRQVYGLALLLHEAANPASFSDGKPKMALWPRSLATGSLPVYFAWTAAISEVLGGSMILVGLLTRLWALSLAGTMATALWLTQIGPAIQSGQTTLGFLPAYPAFSIELWKTPMWQFSLLMIALALVFSGPGAASLDATLARSPSGGGDKPAPPK